jgi:hypothetical protein
MNLLDVIRKQIDTLSEGPHSVGLRSVLRHIEAAYRHLSRGQTQQDDSAFTDAIYRTNQAFEGSIKEAYRILAVKNPESTTTYEIEQYLDQHKVFRDRVLAQFTNYRTQWRNPSTHDYSLDFDEDEAFLAIVSVSAFAKLLLDQISERLSFVAAKKDVETHKPLAKRTASTSGSLVDRIIEIFQDFLRHYAADDSTVPIETEAQLIGALAGFLSTIAPDLHYSVGRVFRGLRPHHVDMVIENATERILIELKRGEHRRLIDDGIQQLELYIQAAKAASGILFLYSARAIDYKIEIRKIPGGTAQIFVLRPASS